jgi:O-acetyl-ADP-ribose deacetylase (regulator of RNase III)
VLGLNFTIGDATAPASPGPKIIAHIVNDIGGWGRGFVVAVSRRWPVAEREYRRWYRERAANDFALGAVQFVPVSEDTWLANMVGQHGIGPSAEGPPIRYEALAACLRAVAVKAKDLGASVHMPRIGCRLAGGRWERIEPLIRTELCDAGIAVTVYDLP